MKKFYLLGALTGLMMSSCANDDLVVKPAPAVDGATPISFRMNVGNMSRGDVNLHAAGIDNFGVWAFKTNDNGTSFKNLNFSTSNLVVIPNYSVDYSDTEAYGSRWTYEKDGQYLKYWDGSYTNTYFFGYGPHNSLRTAQDVTLSFDDNSNATLTFPMFEVGSDITSKYIYSDVTVENNADHVTLDAGTNTTDDPKKVPMHFNRVFSQVRIALYEDIPGYKIQMAELEFASPTTYAGTYGIVAIPADYNATAPTKWTLGSYLQKGQATVVYDYDATTEAYKVPALTFSNCEMASKYLDFAIPTDEIGDSYANRVFSDSINVIPYVSTTATNNVAGTSIKNNSGFQFVMNFVLKSEDTNETITVKNARVYVAPEYTVWAPNTLYTYVFRITKGTTGNTSDDDPTEGPQDVEKALYPIIFDNVTITDFDTEEENEWDVNTSDDNTLNPHDPNDTHPVTPVNP